MVLVLAAASAFAARWSLFSWFGYWDDEGYFLLALRAYSKGEALYDRIDVIYGPLYFQVWTAVARLLGRPFDNDSARILALLVWIGASLGCFALVLRVARSVLAATAAYLLCFPLLVVLRNEPLHPSHSIVLLLPILALAALGSEGRAGRSLRWAACGALVAGMMLMKLNVGAFAMLAFAIAFLRKAPGNLGRGAAFLILLAAPILLMRPLFPIPWVPDLAALETVSLAPFALMPVAGRAQGEKSPLGRQVLAFASGGTLVVAIVVTIALAGGTTLEGLWRVLVLDTLRFPGMFVVAPEMPPRALLAIAVVVQAAVAVLYRGEILPDGSRGTALAILKLVSAAALLALYWSTRWLLAGLPFLWILSLPPGEGDDTGRAKPSTWIIGLLVVAISLQAYPVAGSQLQLALFLVPALAVIGFHDALGVLRSLPAARRRILAGAAIASLAILVHPFYLGLPAVQREYAHGRIPLELPGAESLRLTEGEVTGFRWLVANLKTHGSTFFGVPGLHSLYGWAEQEPPVPFYANAWMLSTPLARQQELARIMASTPDLCVVRHPKLCEVWLGGRGFTGSPIARQVERDFEIAGTWGGYQLLLPNSKPADLILSAVQVPLPEETPASDRDRIALRLAIPALPERRGARLRRLELVQAGSGEALCDSRAAFRTQRMIPVDERGRELPDALPVDLASRRDLLVLCPPSPRMFGSGWRLIRCYDERNEVVARLALVR